MTERANIKVDRETFERHNQFRDMLGVTWAEYLERARRTEETDIEAVVRQVVRDELEQRDDEARSCARCDKASSNLRPHPEDPRKTDSTRMVCPRCHETLSAR
jgi:uncharacterized paraquat-inducible protein A